MSTTTANIPEAVPAGPTDTVTIDCGDCGESIIIPLDQEPPVWCEVCDWEVSSDDWDKISRAINGVGGVTR